MILLKVVGRFKILTAKAINQSSEIEGSFWQRDYYERVIRSEEDCQIVRRYIINNPVQWEMDEHYRLRDTSHHFNRWRYQNNANSPNPNSH